MLLETKSVVKSYFSKYDKARKNVVYRNDAGTVVKRYL